MATVTVDGETLHVELSTWDKVLAVHGSFAIPLAKVAGASAEPPPRFWDALRVIGTGSPLPLKLAGTFLYHGDVVFFDYQRDDNVLVVALAPGASSYRYLFVHVDAPDSPQLAAERITKALAG